MILTDPLAGRAARGPSQQQESMKVTFIGHASILVEAAGVRVLSDPWWSGPCFGAQWWTYPLPQHQLLEDQRIDYIYISHGHHDHLHAGTLATCRRPRRCWCRARSTLAASIRALGFDVIEVSPDRPIAARRWRAAGAHMPTHGDDTLLALSDGRQVCVNLNDALHSAPAKVQDAFIEQLTAWYPTIDYAFCGYGVRVAFSELLPCAGQGRRRFGSEAAGVFQPGMGPDHRADSSRGSGFHSRPTWCFCRTSCSGRTRRRTTPSGQPTCSRRPIRNATTRVVDIAPGFQMADHVITADRRREPVTAQQLARCDGPGDGASQPGRSRNRCDRR